MLDKFIRFFTAVDPSAPVPGADARVALAALLVEAARADGQYATSERAMIDRVLAASHRLDPQGAAQLRELGETAQANAADLVRFTRALKEAVPIEQRVAIIEQIWQVIYADGQRDHLESALVRQLAGLLYVSDVDCGLARQRVVDRLG